MALKATVFKARIQLSDMDHHRYMEQGMTLARHPSETDLRMMLRLLAWSLYADERLEFTKGLSEDDEPELWQRNYADEIELWIELGMPDEARLKKACGRAQQVVVLAYGDRAVPVWWEKQKGKFSRFSNLTVLFVPEEGATALTGLVDRSMDLSVSISDGEVTVSSDLGYALVEPQTLKEAS
ncbi:YaeQ family protein [Ferrimonas marina]|uniref:Uncharacterized conserved protein YaeQ, suppresses RfaH defect n=1 Tax=Ferrimonas marina TaxID=299255 RepID=A0A1M5VRL6_9GAMM|nr:YaeQ family protein [Ferrimonas marina]SHH77614.1 Uncharacterized conserved protein YaeQ, suppresses RfaH defect [Ferrimonas marina]